MAKLWNLFIREESGQGMVEYGLIIALIAIVLIGALLGLSGALDKIFGNISTELTQDRTTTP